MFKNWKNCLALNRKQISKQWIAKRSTNGSNGLNVDMFSNASVFVSQSDDIFANLSLEDWIYRYVDLRDRAVVLMWTNRPAVVVGRHQNPWRECHLKRCYAEDVCVVRRNSGGGTVYQDSNNLNISFISDKRLYNRFNNLSLIQNLLLKEFDIESEITRREDLVLTKSGHKISGTASKVGAQNSYHHLTLLVDVDTNRMKRFIRNQSTLIVSKATESIRSMTANIKSVNNRIQLQDVVHQIAVHFRRAQVGYKHSILIPGINYRTGSRFYPIIQTHKKYSGA